MSISLVRDDPLTLQAGASAVISATNNLIVNHIDYPESSITYMVTSPPSHGTLLKNGSSVSLFTQADLDNNLISHSDPTPSLCAQSDDFFFRASDPGDNQT